MGKTALALCVARSTATAGEPTYFQSLEMGDVSLSDRNLADAAFEIGRPVPYYDIANGTLTLACKPSALLTPQGFNATWH